MKTDPPSTPWDNLRDVLVQAGSKIQRFRSETFWFGDNISSRKHLKDSHLMIITIRAIGPRTKQPEPAELALYDALECLDIHPTMVQLQQHDTHWPCQWNVLLLPEDSPKLPKYSNDNQGVFWNKKGDTHLFVWNIIPINKSEQQTFANRKLTFQVYFPISGALLMEVPLLLKSEPITLHDGARLFVDKASPVGVMRQKGPIHNGTYSIEVSKCPMGDTFLSYLAAGKKILLAKWQEREIRLTLKPACDHCGGDGHSGDNCPYQKVTKMLMSNMNTIRSSVQTATPVPHGFVIVETPSVKHEPKKGTKRPVVSNSNNANKSGPSKSKKKK
ncbi:hypothetical protein VP01_1594g2 [Puccinia sorghi]|uniref:Uncharacterized protein n=1 Tax=Puccinia sorghi TaxID=27349 RepID=A0A0L6VJA2_9BASI|nr:hypothetical protein VP01_1594g2 [Puccinia sorghi]